MHSKCIKILDDLEKDYTIKGLDELLELKREDLKKYISNANLNSIVSQVQEYIIRKGGEPMNNDQKENMREEEANNIFNIEIDDKHKNLVATLDILVNNNYLYIKLIKLKNTHSINKASHTFYH